MHLLHLLPETGWPRTMQLPIFQIDAFTDQVFKGNPAAIVPLDRWLPEATLQAIAMENNLAETAYITPNPDQPGVYNLRWFTPSAEVDLCGHATLATAHHLFAGVASNRDVLHFDTRSGRLIVTRESSGRLTMDFPAIPSRPHPDADAIAGRLGDISGVYPCAVLSSINLIAVYDAEDDVLRFQYTSQIEPFLKQAGFWGLIITAPATSQPDLDFVSRFFAPEKGIPEDPVTGSAHCASAPYWAQRLGKPILKAAQRSSRGGRVECEVVTNTDPARVRLSGVCTPYLSGTITI